MLTLGSSSDPGSRSFFDPFVGASCPCPSPLLGLTFDLGRHHCSQTGLITPADAWSSLTVLRAEVEEALFADHRP